MTTLAAHDDGWTVDDLDDIAEDGLRYELLDGMLLVSPPALVGHCSAACRLGQRLNAALRAAFGDIWRIGCNPGVSMGRRNYRETGRFTGHVRVDEPTPLRFRLDELLGRPLGGFGDAGARAEPRRAHIPRLSHPGAGHRPR